MAHPEQREFMRSAIETISSREALRRVIEIGSYDVNGEMRSLFRETPLQEYVGVDLVEGPGVDIVSLGHQVHLPPESFDLALSAECFEHDQFWRLTFEAMVGLVRPGGWVVFSCAGKGRPEHGTSRSDPALSPGTISRGFQYYKNLEAGDFEASFELNSKFHLYQFIDNPDVFDLYFVGQRARAGESGSKSLIIGDAAIRRIRGKTSALHRLVRFPLRVLARALPEAVYQEFAYRYWKSLDSAQKRWLSSRFSRSSNRSKEVHE